MLSGIFTAKVLEAIKCLTLKGGVSITQPGCNKWSSIANTMFLSGIVELVNLTLHLFTTNHGCTVRGKVNSTGLLNANTLRHRPCG
jgi:hypothetical protein